MPSSVDAVSGSASLAGEREFAAKLENHMGVNVTNATLAFDGGYPPAGFTVQGGQPVTSFPTSIAAPTLAPGGAQGLFLGLSSQLPVAGQPGFDSSRTVDVLDVPTTGIEQTTTVAVTLTDPRYATATHYLKLKLYALVPGTTLVSITPPAVVGGGDSVVTFSGLTSWEFDLSGGVLGHTYVFSLDVHVPNPYGVPFAHKLQMSVLTSLGGAVICGACGPQTSASLAEPSLDGPVANAGAAVASVAESLTWKTQYEEWFRVVFSGVGVPPALPDPAVCSTLPSCPYTGPASVATDLELPNSLATDRRGLVYVAERPSAHLATLSVLRRGDTDEVDADDAEDQDDSATQPRASNVKRLVYEVAASAGFTDVSIGSPQFDRNGNVYLLVGEHGVANPLLVHRRIVRLDRPTYVPQVLFSAIGSDPALGAPASAGFAVTEDGTIYFGRSSSLYRLDHGGPPVAVATFGVGARISATPVVETDGSIAVVVTTGTLGEIYSVRPSGVQRVAHIVANGPGVTPFGYLGIDGAGNLFTLQRVPHAFQRFNCAYSTTVRVLRLDGAAVRSGTSEIAPVEVAAVTQGGHLLLTIADASMFRVSRGGDVYFAVYPAVPICPPAPQPPYPFSNQARVRRVLALLAQPDGSLAPYVLMQRGGVLPTTPFAAFSFALRGREVLVAAGVEGDIVAFRH